MEIGIVVHGPNIIDSGCALKIINALKDFGKVHCRLGGTMGRTAVIDASLENIIDISAKRLPSESVKLFKEEDMDIIFLLNYGKSEVTGHTFGYKVFKNSFLNYNKKFNEKIENNNEPSFIQIERPGEKDGSIIGWNGNKELTSKLAKLFNLKITNPEEIINKYFSEESNIVNIESINNYKSRDIAKNSIENKIKNKYNDKTENNKKIRDIYGVSPDENIFVNGIVIGKSNSENLSLVANNGKIIDIIGGTIKPHGIEKLGHIDIDKAIVKTGLLRKSNPKPRIINNKEGSENFSIIKNKVHNPTINDNNSDSIKNKDNDYLMIAFIDHAAEDIYSLKNIDLAVTIGDDTTLVASDILYRFNIPVIGITDGDLDKVVEKGFIANGSTIIEVESGFDDIVGKAIFKDIFKSNYYLKVSLESNSRNLEVETSSINNNKNMLNNKDNNNDKIIDFKNQILKIVNNITIKYIIKE